MQPTVTIENVQKAFGPVRAVKDVSFQVQPGEIFGLLGPNGAGKTTTIRMMLDIFRPDAGRIELFGSEGMTEEKKDRIGYLPEERGLYRDLRLDTVLLYLATLKGLSEATARKRLDHWLERLELYDHRAKQVQELSRGMQQKAQIIATLIHEPDLIVIDEPFSGLDPVNTRLIKDVFLEQRDAGRSIIMSTHQMYQVEALCNRMVLINCGECVLYGDLAGIKHRFAGNAISITGDGDFSGLPGVLSAQRQNGTWHLALEAGASAQSVFCALAARGQDVRVERFEIAEPSLDDIFVQVVGRPVETEAESA